MVSPASFVTPNVRENAKLQRYVRARTNLFYFIESARTPICSPRSCRRCIRACTPVRWRRGTTAMCRTCSGTGRRSSIRSVRGPTRARGSRSAPRPTTCARRWSARSPTARGASTSWCRVQTDPHRMPIEDATVKWPERLSPYVPVAELRLARQRFDEPAQLAFADNLSYNPWHSLEAHRPLGNQNRARRRIYLELSRLRQSMNQAPHIEPTGAERFTGSGAANGDRPGRSRARQAPQHRTRAKA